MKNKKQYAQSAKQKTRTEFANIEKKKDNCLGGR